MSRKGISFTALIVAVAMLGLMVAGCSSTPSASDSKEIRIGANIEMTGSVANYGKSALMESN